MQETNPPYDMTVYHPPYVVQNGCLYMLKECKEQQIPVKLADFVPTLQAEIIRDDGAEQTRLFRIAATHCTGAPMQDVTVTADEMQTMNWLLARWGKLGAVQPMQNIHSRIRHAILRTKTVPEVCTIYQQTGWKKIDGKYQFLMPKSDRQIIVELQGKLQNYSFATCTESELSHLTSMLQNSFAPAKIMLPMLAVTFLSPLNHFLKMAGCEPKFVTALIGRTGSRKSTLAALFLSFFGRFSAADLPLSFHDTANSILLNIYYLKDVLTCIDDFHPGSAYSEQGMREIAQSIARFYGDRIGRARLNSRADLQATRPPTGNALITAEYPPEISASGNARYLILDLDAQDVSLDKLTAYQKLAQAGILSGIMRRYTDWLAASFLQDETAFVHSLADQFEQYRNDFLFRLQREKITFHNRTPDMLAHLKIGLQFLLQFSSAHDQKLDAEKVMQDFETLLLQNSSDHAEQTAAQHPTIVFCEKLRSLLDSGRCYVETKGHHADIRRTGCIGLQDEGSYFLFADAAHSEVRKLCAEQGECFTISKRELLRQLAKEKILLPRGRSNTFSMRDNAGSVVTVAQLIKANMSR